MALAIDTLSYQHEQLELKASQHLQDTINSWIAFCETALEIQSLGVYKRTHSSWNQYVRDTWNIDSSMIRQYKMVLPYAKGIITHIPETITKPTELIKLKRVCDSDNPLMPDVYSLANSVAHELGNPITESVYRHALEVLEESEITQGLVTVSEGQIDSKIKGALETAVIQKIEEAKKRSLLYLTKIPINCKAKRINGNQWLIESDRPLNDNFEFRIYVKDDDNEHNNKID